MNICLFGASFLPAVGGMEYVIHNLANSLVDNGHKVTVVVKRKSWKGPCKDKLYQLNRYSLPFQGCGKLGIDYSSALFTVSLLNSVTHFDVLNCHGVSYSGTRARVLSKLWKLPLVMTPHGEDVQRIHEIGYGLRLDASWDKKIAKNLKAADYVTAISQSVHADLDMLTEERIVDIPNGIHTSRFNGEKSSYLREHLGLSESCRVLLSVGRNHVKKGYDYGIQAVSRLVNELGCQDVHYVIVGRGVSEHRKLIAESRAEKFVSLIDEVSPEDVIQCYKSSDIFFSPSIVEGLSLVSIEAMAAGLPLVVTNVPGNDDVVKANGCGLVVQSQDPEDMANGLYRLLTDDLYRMDLAALSVQSAVKYDWAEIAKQYVKVYRMAIQRHEKDIRHS